MKRKNKRFWKPVVIGFGVVYMLTMGLATFLVKEKFKEGYTQQFRQTAVSMLKRVSERQSAMEGEEWNSEQSEKDFYQYLANGYLWEIDDESMQVSFAFYDKEKNLLAKTRDEIGGNSVWEGNTRIREYVSYDLDDFLSSKEKETLAQYYWENILLGGMEPEKYRISILTPPQKEELWGIYVQRITWTEEEDWEGENYIDPLYKGGHSFEIGALIDYSTGEEMGEIQSFVETDSEIVWEWLNPEIDEELRESGKVFSTAMYLPYMISYRGTYKDWKRWTKSQYLHDFPAQNEFVWERGIEEPPLIVESDGFYYRGKYQLQVGMAEDPFCYIEMRMEGSPWLAAVNYMKYVYLAGLAMTLACMAKIIYAFRKIYDTQMALEETRRDFTNAMAHELKTPLGIIRNFAENLMEHNMEEKRDYYLAQIIGQTEEMDHLVIKMIEISKLDSEDLVLKKEVLSFGELIKEQMARLEPMVKEKNLRVQYQENGNFLVNGDREYLAKAVWNLLDNAVEYNISHGSIRIKIEKDQCVIENTGSLMEKEEILHAFELFYTQDKSRSKKERHMGMGLFLTKKILGLHGMEIGLEAMEDGIRVVIKISPIPKKH